MKDFTMLKSTRVYREVHWRSSSSLKTVLNVRLWPFLAVLVFLFLSIPSVDAQIVKEGVVPTLTPTGGMEIDGDAQANTFIPSGGDWFFNADPPNLATESIFKLDPFEPRYPNIEGQLPRTIFYQDGISLGNQKDPTIFATSNKVNDNPNDYEWKEGNAAQKGEIQNVVVHFTKEINSEDVWCLFAADRANVNGDAYIDFEFLQEALTLTGSTSGGFSSDGEAGGRTLGDILISVEFNNGGSKPNVYVYKWINTGSVEVPDYQYEQISGSDLTNLDFFAVSNKSETIVPFPVFDTDPINAEETLWQYEINQWVEGAFNITDIFNAISDPCTKISTLFIRTRSSGESIQSELYDFPGDPIQLDIDLKPEAPVVADVTNCGPWQGILNATGCENGSINWYDAVDAETPVEANSSSFSPPEITTTTSYWVSCTIEGCEGERKEVKITINPLPVVTADDTSVCTGSTVQLSATPAGGAWSGDYISASGEFDAGGLAADDYIVTYTYSDGNGCENSDTATVTVDALPVVTADDTSVCIGSTVQLSASPIGGTWSGDYISASGEFNADGLAADDYIVTYTYSDGNGCENSDTATVTVDALPVVTADDTSVCIGSTVQLSASPIGGTWSGDYISASGEFNADGLAADDYIVTYTYSDGNGCENSDTATVTVDALPVVTADDTSVCIGSTVQLSASPIGGTWSGDYISASGEFNADGLAADDYIVTYTYSDGNGCENSDTATVTVDALPVVTADDTSVCIGSTVQLSASPIGGTWSGDYISASGEFNADGLAADDYIVTYTYSDGNGCENSDTATVTVDALPVVTADDTSVCIGSTVQLSASPIGGTWSGDYISASGEFNADGLAADDYIVTYTYSDGNGCENSDTATVTVDALPVVTADDTSVCIGSTVQLSASPIGGTWSGDYISASGEFNADGLAADDYIVTYTYSDGNGCENSDTATVTVDALPVVTADDTSVCIGSTVQLSASPIGGTWSGDYISASGEFNADGLAADDYIVTYTYSDGNGCENSDTATVTVDALPVVTADDTSVCIGSTVQLSASPIGGTWSGDYISASGEFNADGLAADDYIVTYTYSDGNGCENSDTATVTVDALPVVTADDTSVCIGSTVQLSASPIGGTWSGDYISASGEFNADGLAADDYIVTYTYSDGNGCENSDTATVTVDALPVVTADDTSVCIGSTVQLSASPIGGTWSGDYISASGEFNADGLAADDYIVTYTYSDGNGCENSDTATVTVDALPVVTADDTSVCIGSTVQLSASPIGGTWSGDYISASGEFNADGLAADDYIVTYTYSDGNGCENSDTATVTVVPLPDTPDYQPSQADCLGGDGGLVFLNVGDNMYYSINGSDFVLYDGEISLAEGFYDFRIRYDEDGCISDEFEVEIQRPDDDVVTLVPNVIQPDCDTFLGTIMITNAGELDPDLNYTVTNQDTNTDYYSGVAYPIGGFTGLPAGNYNVSVISDNGCVTGNVLVTLEEPICEEFEGCTLGYWKNHTNRWECYSTCTLYTEVFGTDEYSVPSELQGLTLQEVLNLGGGGIYNLGRQSVAALLNACHDNIYYELTSTNDVIAYVNENFNNAGAAGSYLDMLNNAGCTMGGSKATTAPSDDCEAYEKPKGKGKIKNAKAASDISTYPVPFKETVNVTYDFDYTSDVSIEVFDMRGQHLRTYKDKKVTKGSVTRMNVDFALKANQMYILKVTTDRETFVKQIVSSKKQNSN